MSLRILQVSAFDAAGGAARSTFRLHQGLNQRGHDCRMLVARRDTDAPTVRVHSDRRDIGSRLRRRLRRSTIMRDAAAYRDTRPGWPEKFTDDRSWRDWEHEPGLSGFDVINLQWTSGLLDYRRFFSAVPGGVPIVWTFRDMNTFTGGCHYDAGCSRFTGRCGACPQLGSHDNGDLSRRVWSRKEDLFSSLDRERLHIVTPSAWMAGEVSRSSLLGDRFEVSVIPNGVNTEEFAPRDRAAAREALGIPAESEVALFVAYSVAPRRKGFSLLVDALRELSGRPNLFALSVGAGTPDVDIPVPALHLGKITQNRLLSLAYSASDLYVIPSLQDNLPSTVLESMACGTPVVGFDVGGVPEMVRPGVTGALAPVGDVSALAAAISGLLADRVAKEDMSGRCRRVVLDEYGMDSYVSGYESLYQRLVGPR